MEDNGVLTDQAMKEMAEQLKSKYDDITSKLDKLKEQNIYLKKDLITLYSVLRIADNFLDYHHDDDETIKIILEIGRSIASSMLDQHIFNL